MTGNISPSGVVLGTSTVTGVGAVALHDQANHGLSPFKYMLIATLIIVAVVLLLRFVKYMAARGSAS